MYVRSLDPLRGVNCRVAVRARSPGRLSAKTSIGKPSVLIGPLWLCSHTPPENHATTTFSCHGSFLSWYCKEMFRVVAVYKTPSPAVYPFFVRSRVSSFPSLLPLPRLSRFLYFPSPQQVSLHRQSQTTVLNDPNLSPRTLAQPRRCLTK